MKQMEKQKHVKTPTIDMANKRINVTMPFFTAGKMLTSAVGTENLFMIIPNKTNNNKKKLM